MLEEEWGVYLCGKREYEAAIVHLIEAGLVISQHTVAKHLTRTLCVCELGNWIRRLKRPSWLDSGQKQFR